MDKLDTFDDEWMFHLDFVRSDIDPATVKPIETRQLASVINEFLLRSADILNEFCAKFEDRMMELDLRLETFERMVTLMERKLENIRTDEEANPKVVTEVVADGEGTALGEAQKETPGAALGENKTDERQEKAPEGTVKAKEHPQVAKYFRMLKMGVPEAAVKQKMSSEGMDGAILNDPDKPMALPKKPREEGRTSLSSTDESYSSTSEE
uniref:Coiled-coil domain-containing protein 104 n=1 Tax=Globodera pallida TaxID=36090 RepID=A0A183BS06_GLOPA